MEKKSRKERETDAQLQLAIAMNRMASVLENLQDPVLWQKTIANALLNHPELGELLRPSLPERVEAITVEVKLSDEERDRLASTVYEAIQPQLDTFEQFVQASLQDMPPHRLKRLAEQIEAGAVPKLAQRKGCVFVELDTGYEAYLGM